LRGRSASKAIAAPESARREQPIAELPRRFPAKAPSREPTGHRIDGAGPAWSADGRIFRGFVTRFVTLNRPAICVIIASL
jgi:hypothetical protein